MSKRNFVFWFCVYNQTINFECAETLLRAVLVIASLIVYVVVFPAVDITFTRRWIRK